MVYADLEYCLSVALLTTAMLGMGGTLTPADFLKVARSPQAICLMYLVQVVITPLVAIGIARLFDLPPGLSIGLLLIAALPGGLFSNIVTYLGKGNVALSVSATALASLTCLFTTSLVLRVAGRADQPWQIQMPIARVLAEICLCMILPLLVGMFIRRFAVKHHAKISTVFIRLSMVILAAFIVAALSSGRIRAGEYGWRPPLAFLLFCAVCIWLCYAGGALLRMSVNDQFTIGMECLVRNVQLGVLLKASIFPPGTSDEIGDGILYALLFYGGLCMVVAGWEAVTKRLELGLVYGRARERDWHKRNHLTRPISCSAGHAMGLPPMAKHQWRINSIRSTIHVSPPLVSRNPAHVCITLMRIRPLLLATLSVWLVTSLLTPLRAWDAAPRRPNVVVILTDDQGWGDLSLNGNRNLNTANIDRLARQGAQFDRFFVCPVCSPTRAEFLTGRYHPRSGVFSTSAGGERMDLDERTIGDTFAGAGYATAAFGKWHNGMQYPYHPNGRGFSEYYGFCSGHWGDYFSPPLDHNGKIVRGDGFLIDDFTDHAMDFIEAHRDEPFFVYLPLNTPHSPMQVPDRWWNAFKDKELAMHNRDPQRENLPHVRAALAMCENIDWNVGRLVAKLDALDLTDNTIVVYFCDNGPNGFRWNGGMKGRKGSTDEGGVRSPLIVRWPGKISAGRTIAPIAGAIDLLPTLADLAGIPVASKKPLDGVSLKPLLTAEDADWPSRRIFSHWRGKVSVRTQQHRLDHQGKLYDMSVDPGQNQDVSDEFSELAAELRSAVRAWKEELLPELSADQRPFLVGHDDYRYTQMPARDGIAHGNIKRSNRFPNCSYFSNWTSLEDKITWFAEVAADGVYEVELQYACPPADVGATIELRMGDSRLEARIAQPHESPARGGEHDRVGRAESYVKDWATVKLGEMRLTKGQRGMTLRALSIPGSQVMEFRLLMFTRQDSTPDKR